MPGEPLTAEWWAELDGVLADAANMAYDSQFFALHDDCERLRAVLPPVAPDGADLDVETLIYIPTWQAWEKFADKATKEGSGPTLAQNTGAAMMLGWLIDTYLPARRLR